MADTLLDQVRGTPTAESGSATPYGTIGAGPYRTAIRQGVQSQLNRPTANILDSIKAAAGLWSTSSLIDLATRERYPDQEDFNVAARLNELPFPPTKAEERVLRDTNSDQDFNDRVEFLLKRREQARVAGDNSLAAFVTGMFDPVHVAVDALTLGTARALSAGRVAASLSAAGGTASVTALEYTAAPIEPSDILTAAMMNGAAVGALHRTPRNRIEGQQFSEDLHTVSRDFTPEVEVKVTRSFDKDGNLVETPKAKPTRDTQVGARDVAEVMSESKPTQARKPEKVSSVDGPVPARQFLESEAPRTLGGTREATTAFEVLNSKLGGFVDDLKVHRKQGGETGSTYDPATKTITLGSDAHIGTLAHELAHAATVEKIDFGRRLPDSAHGRLVREIAEIRDMARKAAEDANLEPEARYYLGDGVKPGHELEEFVAGLYSGNKGFNEFLQSLQAPHSAPGNTVLQKLWDALRRMLGMTKDEADLFRKSIKTVDELIDTPLPPVNSRPNVTSDFLFHSYSGPTTIQGAKVDAAKTGDSMAKSIGMKVSWNLNKTMGTIGNKDIADMLVSDPLNPTQSSVASVQRSIHADLSAQLYVFEDALKGELANRGFRWYHNLTDRGRVAKERLEYEISEELVRRESLSRYGREVDVDPSNPIHRLADRYEEVMDKALKAERDAGIEGAINLDKPIRGYFQRSWNPASLQRMDMAYGGDLDAIARDFSGAMRNVGLDSSERLAMAKAILDRTRRRGDMSDNFFRGHSGNELVLEVRDSLTRQGVPPQSIERIVALLEGRADEAGKASRFKHRMDIDMGYEMVAPDGTVWKVLDIMDTDLTRLGDVRIQNAAGLSALGHFGMVTPTEVGKMRTRYVQSADPINRRKASELFDNTVDTILGNPVGEDMPNAMRIMSAVTQMVGLAYSGLWQVTEYAKMGMRFGLLKTAREVIQQLPGFREVVASDSKRLVDVLSRNAHQDLRMRPLLRRLEDGYGIGTEQGMLQSLQYLKQSVPFLNGMAYVQRHQARVSANLMVDAMDRAARGDAKARTALSKYGIDDEVLNTIRHEIDTNGNSIDKWSDGAWERVRDPLTRMVDDNVLRSKVGEIPAFATFSQLGKFIFTFRSFVLGAHNKILAGTLVNDGAGAWATMMAYQLPLTMLMTQAASVLRGDGFIDDTKQWANAAFTQAGGLGLFSDLAAAFFGGKDQFGAPGLIAIDRGYRVMSSALQGDIPGVATNVMNAVPLLGVVPFTKAVHKLWE